MNDCLLILGMHRSGTSALAGALKLLGVDLGSRLMPGREGENEAGFFENLGVYGLHLQLLFGLGYTWHDLRSIPTDELLGPRTEKHREQLQQLLQQEFSRSPLWAVKDPRLCRLLPLWLQVLDEIECSPRCAIIFRHPAESAGSLALRDRFSAEKAAFLWMDHNLQAERQTRQLPRTFVDFSRLLEDPLACLTAIGERLGLDWPVGPAAAASELGEFLRPELRHHTRQDPEDRSLGRLSRQASDLFMALRESHLGDGEAQRERFDRAGKVYRETFDSLDPLLLELTTQSPPGREQMSELAGVLTDRTTGLALQDQQIQQQKQQLDRYEQRLNALSERLESSLLSRQAERRETSETLFHEIDDLKQRLTLRSRRMQRLEERLDEYRQALSQVPSAQQRLKQRLESLERSLAGELQLTELLKQKLKAAEHSQHLLAGALNPLREALGETRTSLDRQEKLLQAARDRQRGLERDLSPLRESLAEARDRLDWQGESLVELRCDLERSAERWRPLLAEQTARLIAQDERLRQLAGSLDNVRQNLAHSANLAEMMWVSKPWRAYLWLGRVRRAVGRRLTRARDRLRRRAVSPAAEPVMPAVAAAAEAPRANLSLPARESRYRALIIDHRLPTPDQDSGSLRMANLITILQELGFRVTFLPHNLNPMEPYASQMSSRDIEIIARPAVDSIAEHLESRGAGYDLVIVCRVPIARQCLDDVLTWCPEAKVVFDTVDLQHLRKERQARLEGDLTLMEEARRIKQEELTVARSTDVTWVVSPYEENLLQQEAPELRVQVVPNIHRIFGSKTGFAERRDILFIGGFEHPPNVDAAQWLVQEILPLVNERLPELRLYLIGSKPTARVHSLASDRVLVTGYVPDVEPYFAGCRLSVAPLRYGAGVKGKVNQSMAYGVPCVLTQIAAEGMALVHGADAMIANDTASFADCIVDVYQDADLWQKLSEGGLENVRRHFSFEVARAAVERCLRTVGHRSAGGQAESAT